MVVQKTLRRFLFVVTGLLVAVACVEPGFGRQPVLIRVALVRDRPQAFVAVVGSYELVDGTDGSLLKKGRNLAASKVTATGRGIRIGKEEWSRQRIVVKVRRKAGLYVNKRPYRGDLLIAKEKGNNLLFVNTVDIESYVKGVLVHEISPKWPLASIKAQAVAARTYAFYQRQVMKDKLYDVTADVSSQVYGGSKAEKDRTNRAVNFTAGEILTYKGKVFPAYFHATCGGVTEKASELWQIDVEPLAGGRLCSFCSSSPHYFWKTVLELKAIRDRLGERYVLQGEAANLAVKERNPTGRVRTLVIKDKKDKTMEISAKDFRQLMGPDVVRSTNFSITLEQGKVVLSGKGWGHGVGLCQWGAFGMARQGYIYEKILEFYYPGAVLQSLDTFLMRSDMATRRRDAS